jgi:hypothetical protein
MKNLIPLEAFSESPNIKGTISSHDKTISGQGAIAVFCLLLYDCSFTRQPQKHGMLDNYCLSGKLKN